MSSESSPNKLDYRVLRVTQLDTSELDEALIFNLKQSINQDYFKYIQLNFFQKYHIEIFTGLKLLVWYYTYYKNGQTVGQSIFDWYYQDQTKVKKLLHMIVYCMDELILEKLPGLVKYLLTLLISLKRKFGQKNNQSSNESGLEFERFRNVDKFFYSIKVILKCMSFVNYITFLLNGRYLNLWERFIKLRPIYKKEQYMRSFDHKIFERELLWQSYFSLFKLADGLFDFKKFQGKLKKKFNPNKNTIINKQNIEINKCGICDAQPPTMVHCAVNFNADGCKHVYCYVCIKKALNDDNNNFLCQVCDKYVNNVEMYLVNQNF